MIKKEFKRIRKLMLGVFFRIISAVFSYSSRKRWNSFKSKLHTLWISSEFKSIGNFTVINAPIDLRGGNHISIGSGVVIGKRAVITAWEKYKTHGFIPEILIGNNTNIGDDCHITAINKIIIGNNVLMGKKITITDNGHGDTTYEAFQVAPIDRPLYSKGTVIIEDNVWIGDKATILPNVKIGKNAIVGANALVAKDVPANCIVGGVPAIIIKLISN